MALGYSRRFNDFMAGGGTKPKLIDLSVCDPPRFGFGPDPRVYDESITVDPEPGYPSPHCALVSGIAERSRSFTGTDAAFDVIISNGCGATFGVLAIALKGMSVGIQCPFYIPIYEYFRRTTDLWYVRCRPELDWMIDIELLRKELEQRNAPGALFLVNPSNPSGGVHDEKTLRSLVNLAGEFDQVLITDEVYDEISFVPFCSLLSLAKDVPVIYLHGFSKVWRAPEIRLGFTLLQDPEEKSTALFEDILNISNLGFGVNPSSQTKATMLLREDVEYRRKQFDQIRKRRDALNDAISRSDNLSNVLADGATYQCIKTPWKDWEVCTRLLEEHNILVTPGSVYDPFIGDKYIRVVFLNTIENLRQMVSCLDSLDR